MKRITLIFIAIALILTIACTDTEQVLPANFNQVDLDFQEETILQGPNIIADVTGIPVQGGSMGEASEKQGKSLIYNSMEILRCAHDDIFVFINCKFIFSSFLITV